LPTVVIPPRQTRPWRSLIAYRQVSVGRRGAGQNRLRALLVGQGLPAPRGHRAWTEVGRRGSAQHAKALAGCGPDELWQGLLEPARTESRRVRGLIEQAEAELDAPAKQGEGVRISGTIPGVGTRTAETVAAHLHQPGRFDSGKQVSAYVGLVPGSPGRASPIGGGGSRGGGRRSCGSCWPSAPGPCGVTTAGRGRPTSG
jgi:transposase